MILAGYPEGHTDAASADDDVVRLKEKVDAGADFIVTQLFYNVPKYLLWLQRCRVAGEFFFQSLMQNLD